MHRLKKNKLYLSRNLCLFLLFSFALLLRLFQLDADYSYSDEPAYVGLARLYFRYFYKLKATFWQLDAHPPIGKYLYGLISLIYPQGEYTPGRTFSAILGASSCVLTVLIGEMIANFHIGFLAGILLSLSPYFIAYTRICGLESPSVFFSLLALLLLLKYNQKNRFTLFFFSALVFGLVVGIRYNNILIGIPILYSLIVKVGSEKTLLDNKTAQRKIIYLTILYFLIAVVIFYLSWPWIWDHPIKKIFQTHFFQKPKESKLIYFLGKRQRAPLSYFFIYFLVTTPSLLLISSLYGIIRGRKVLLTKNYFMLILFFFSPFLLTFTRFRQEGIRYILTMYPAMSIFSSIGVFLFSNTLASFLKIQNGFKKLSFVYVIYLCVIYILFHPYELVYYNEFVGGPSTVYKRKLFQIGTWGSGITKAIKYIDTLPEKNITVDFCLCPVHVIPPLNRRDIFVQKVPKANFLVINAEYEWYRLNPKELDRYKLLYSVNVMGAPVVKIYEKISKDRSSLLPLDSTQWEASSNYQPKLAAFAIDRNLETCWSSFQAQSPGMYFQVDMKRPYEIQGVGLVTWTTPSAFPLGYVIEVSLDGKNWHKVTEGKKNVLSDMVLEIFFQKITARFVRIVQTDFSNIFGWTIHELYVYSSSTNLNLERF